MVREIILVEVVNKSDMSTDDSKAFTSVEKAEDYFVSLIGKFHITDDDEQIEGFLESGYCDFNDTFFGHGEEHSIIIKEISFEED
jgi:hypothetical protein